jgi:hypothetical protein
MTIVKMEKECGCFKRGEYEGVKTFEKKDEALLYAQAVCAEMNETFCKKHRFGAAETSEKEITIRVAMCD